MALKDSTVTVYTSARFISRFASLYPSPTHLGFATRNNPLHRSSCCSSHHLARCGRSSMRCYATQSSTSSDSSDALPPWPRTAHPTPYEILGIQRGAPYTKRRFYQLVKLYHPDTHDASGSGQSTTTQKLSNDSRLERYRLIVAANDLLSDPDKRRLYDNHGIGWNNDRRPRDYRQADREWKSKPGNASRNATWEDWERWRNEREGKPSSESPMSNGTYATLVVCMCMIGALAHMFSSEEADMMATYSRQRQDGALWDKMRASRAAASEMSRNDRIDSFLRERENSRFEFRAGKLDGPSPSDPNRFE
ncbi:uncharacterized protein CPUR_00606 [Claviceps purpurea 20.1]|uniref:J domain-containing protein n=1 Tax=Claviceps purpurea (strain 20.1) TaxID=1111077 RepID=M1W9H4_CLAP2|nr:hypothetical protein E4U38_005545 [Claviceps purpurea]KAG6283882.1 hypothetical protein E4U48_003745 [Claviceps purpurea]KAG6287747.1 hypothetical protein E4U46_003847 [Claviceps purpurea]KAG6307735.1 hypothetical protein E4U45_003594 [Claviceps purpurea]CCE27134.1 uncharacterized protein CPUR_00606 [Claviceps purpurea 20.1]